MPGEERGGLREGAEWVTKMVLAATLLLYIATLWPSWGARLSVPARLLVVPLGCGALVAIVWRIGRGRPADSRIRFGRSSAATAVEQATFGRHSSRAIQAIALLALVSLVIALAVSPGSPSKVDGLYFVVNHADRHQVSEYAYLVARTWQTRQYLSGVALATVFLRMYLDEQRDREAIRGP